MKCKKWKKKKRNDLFYHFVRLCVEFAKLSILKFHSKFENQGIIIWHDKIGVCVTSCNFDHKET